jgi:hypothetical protein
MRVMLLIWALIVLPSSVASAAGEAIQQTDVAEETEEVRGRTPLMLVPAGCAAPELPEVVFVGTVIQRDFRTVRWEIRQVRAGDPESFGAGQQVDVRFGLDGQFLTIGEDYLVSTRRDPFIGVLISGISPQPEVFGGSDVVGLAPNQVECPPEIEVARTFHTDGSEISTKVFGTMTAERGQVLAAVLMPLGLMMLLFFVLALVKFMVGTWRREPRSQGSVAR